MITKYDKIKINKNLTFEVNWSKAVTPCKKVRINNLKDKSKTVINKDDLFILLFMFATEKEQDGLVKVGPKEKVKGIERLVKVKANKDLKKGDTIAFITRDLIPESIYNELEIGHDKVVRKGLTEEETQEILKKFKN